VIYIDNYLERDYRADHGGILSNACSIISAVEADNVHIANLVVDGNKENNDYLNGCRGGGVYIHKTKNVIVEDVIVRNFNGDGISWQITEHVTVRNCDVSECSSAGLHPGAGSPKTTIENNNSHHNVRDGLYICWRVRDGSVSNNKFQHNGRHGITTGHKDTDMVFTANTVSNNGSDGIHFRGERPANATHRNIFRSNVIENNRGYGFSINNPAESVLLENNIIRDTGDHIQKGAIYIFQHGLPLQLSNNQISGHSQGEVLYETKGDVYEN